MQIFIYISSVCNFYHFCLLQSCSETFRSFLLMLKLKPKLILVNWQKPKIFLFKFIWHCVFLTMFIFLIFNGKWYCSHPFKGIFLIFFFYSWFILFSHVVFIRAIPNFADFHFTYRVLKLSFTLLQLVSNISPALLDIFFITVHQIYASLEIAKNFSLLLNKPSLWET